MDNFILIVIVLSTIISALLGFIIGAKITKKTEEVKKDTEKASDNIAQEIKPEDPFPRTTALDQINQLDIKRSIRNTATPLLLNPTGGLHASKIRSQDTWLRV